MSEAQEVTFDAPAAKKPTVNKARKPRKPPRRASFHKPAEKSGEPFPGLTRTACAAGCNEKGCAISGKVYCAHPTKGGLQAADQSDPAALKRLQAARTQLGVQIDPDRFK